jgi:hypothetical protein
VPPVAPCGPAGPTVGAGGAGDEKQALNASVITVAAIRFEYFMMILLLSIKFMRAAHVIVSNPPRFDQLLTAAINASPFAMTLRELHNDLGTVTHIDLAR